MLDITDYFWDGWDYSVEILHYTNTCLEDRMDVVSYTPILLMVAMVTIKPNFMHIYITDYNSLFTSTIRET